jgi:hypothetical protein
MDKSNKILTAFGQGIESLKTATIKSAEAAEKQMEETIKARDKKAPPIINYPNSPTNLPKASLIGTGMSFQFYLFRNGAHFLIYPPTTPIQKPHQQQHNSVNIYTAHSTRHYKGRLALP